MSFPFHRFLSLGLLVLGALGAARAADDPRVYELRTYTAMPGKIDAVLARFRDHTLKIFERHGMINVGYFVPMDAVDGAGEKLVYVLEHPSREAATAAWKAFNADPEWQSVRAASEAQGKIVAKTESVFLSATDFSPKITVGKGEGPRVFELRTYTTPAGGLPPLDARFRDYTVGLFAQHGITNIAYWHPVDADKGAGHTLIYLIVHASREAAVANWAAFHADQKWVDAKAASEKKAGGSLTTEVKSVFLTPTDFSPMK
jgi:hypothetical protein